MAHGYIDHGPHKIPFASATRLS